MSNVVAMMEMPEMPDEDLRKKFAKKFGKMTPKEIEAWLLYTLEQTIENVIGMAMAVYDLETIKKRDISHLESKIPILPFLRQIAVGELSAKAFIKFPPGKLASKRIYTLPVDQQEAIADKGTVTIKTTAGVIEKDPNVLTMKEVNQVLAVGKILEPEEQDARKEKLDTDRMDRPKTTAPRYYWYDGTKSLRVARTGDVPINDIRAEVAIGGYCVPWFNKEQTRIIRKMAQDKNITFDNMIEMLVIKAIGGSK